MALGDRRAHAARDFLISLGVAPERIQTVSFGETRPAVAESNERAWALNRRDEFVYIQGGDPTPPRR
jgi:peptidoglycan-associated lipoprotein